MKSLVMVADGKPVLVLLRGDHQLSETKFASVCRRNRSRPAHPEEIRDWFGADAGSLGPVGVKNMRVLADDALRGRRNMIAGANKDDYHLRNVTPGEDFKPSIFDLRQVAAGDTCFELRRAARSDEDGRDRPIFKLGYKYSESMGLRVLDESGERSHADHGLVWNRDRADSHCAIELYHDKDGMSLPASIAPFQVVITPVNFADATQREAARALRRMQRIGHRRPARRSRRTPGREVQRRGSDRHSVPHHCRQEARRRQGGIYDSTNEIFCRCINFRNPTLLKTQLFFVRRTRPSVALRDRETALLWIGMQFARNFPRYAAGRI